MNQGTLSGSATGIAANYMDPFTIDLSAEPISGRLGTASENAIITFGTPSIDGTTAIYPVQIETPVNVSQLIIDDDPVDVTVTIRGTVRFEGEYTRQILVWDVPVRTGTVFEVR